MAIQGNGFFVLNQGKSQVFTRDGTFQLNDKDELVSSTGQLVQGFGVDSNYNIVPGVIGNITIPFGAGAVAQATSTASFSGNLNANGTLPTTVSDLTSQPLYLSNGAGGTDPTNPPTGATFLTAVTDSSGTPQFQVGDVITLTGKRNGASIANQTLTVSGSTTLANLQSFMSGALGIDQSAGANGGVATLPGTSIPVDGTFTNAIDLKVDGNPGAANDLSLDANSLTITRGASTITPMTWNKNATSSGESISTSMTAYDSLGNAIPVDLTAVLESKSATSGSVWHFYATSPNASTNPANTNTVIGSGTISFDSTGKYLSSANNSVKIDRSNTGATPNLSFTLDFSGATATGTTSSIQESSQDGSAPSSMTDFRIGNDGIITGSYGGIHRTVGQVALATFENDEGLVNDGSNTYSVGPNSGTAVITAPLALSAGSIVSNALEGSNVDLSSEFVKMISASTAFSASSRVITSSNQLLQDLLSAAR